MPFVLVVHAADAQLVDVVKAACDFARSAHPDVDASTWRARRPEPQSILQSDDVYDSLGYTVFEWGDE